MNLIIGLVVPSSEALSVRGDDGGPPNQARGPPDGGAVAIRDCVASLKGNDVMKRLTAVLLVTIAALVAAAPSALAAPPTLEREFVDVTFTDEESCGFPVEIHQRGFVIGITWVDEDGSVRRIEAFPQGRATLTNLTLGRASPSTPPGLLTLPITPTGVSPWLARGPGMA